MAQFRAEARRDFQVTRLLASALFKLAFCLCFAFNADWLVENGRSSDFETLPVQVLVKSLCEFYASVRTQKGECYSKGGMVAIRAGLNRYLNTEPHNRNLDIIKDVDFVPANKIFSCSINVLCGEGKLTRHKQPITASDMRQMYTSGVLSDKDPVSLQRKVFVELTVHFGVGGKRGLRDLKKSSFSVERDEYEREYVITNYSQTRSKFHRSPKQSVMYAQNDPSCPVKSFKMYLEKLHPVCDALFQRPNLNWQKNGEWYTNQQIGKNTCDTFMQRISAEAQLSHKYTNKCLRATVAMVLSEATMDQGEVSKTPACSAEESLVRFFHQSTGAKVQISSILHRHGNPQASSSLAIIAPNS